MKRRNFLSMASMFGIAPNFSALPSYAASASANVTKYNGFQYGLAVFHARTRASLSAADLVNKLSVNASVADAMIAKMIREGHVKASAAGAVQAISRFNGTQTPKLLQLGDVDKALDEYLDQILQNEDCEQGVRNSHEEEVINETS